MASPRRVSARQSSTSAKPAAIDAVKSLPIKSKGKEETSRDSGAAMASPMKPGTNLEDRSSDVEFVGLAASTSRTVNHVNGTTKPLNSARTSNLQHVIILNAVATRSSSEELTDLDILDKALTPANKKAVQRKRKAKAKDSLSRSGSADAEGSKNGATEAKPKVKRKRTKKIQGPYLPVVQYPLRDLKGKKFIGAHVSISEGAHYAPHRALNLGARAFGLFVKSQKQWAGKPLTEDSIKLFPLRCKGKTETEPDENGKSSVIPLGDGIGFDPLRHIVPHGSYLTNLCHNGEEQRKKSYDNFLTELQMAEALGIGLFNFHPGSTLGQPREEAYKYLAGCINEAHRETKSIVVLLENMASRKNIVGGSFEDLAAVIALVKDKSRIGVCFDTCHGFAAGYDLRSEDAYNATWKEFDEIVGLKYLKAFHVNDSMKELASGRDLHQNIGAGELGLSAFHLLMRDPRFDNLPFILETPMLSGSFNTDAVMNQVNGQSGSDAIASSSKVKFESKAEKELLDDHGHSHGDDADIEDNGTGQPGSTIDATTWKREIDILQELEKVPFGQTNDTIDKLSSEIIAIVAGYRAREEEQKKAAKEAKDAIKEAKKAAQRTETGAESEIVKEKKPRAPRTSKKKAPKEEAMEEAAIEGEMEIDSSEVDQLASDYEG